MAKRQIQWSEEKIQRFIKEGRGQGEGRNYKPWLTVQDFPSIGRVTRGPGWKTEGRLQQFMSDLETRYSFLLDWADDVVDFKEQFPILDREETMRIAENLGIKHPMHKNIPIVMTTDFLITINLDGKPKLLARTIKYSSDLENNRVLEKFEIEKECWNTRGVDWAIVTEKEIPKIFVSNIEWVHASYWLEELSDLKIIELEEFSSILLERISSFDGTMNSLTRELEQEFNLEDGTILYLVRHLFARKKLQFDMNKKFSIKFNTSDFTVNKKEPYI